METLPDSDRESASDNCVNDLRVDLRAKPSHRRIHLATLTVLIILCAYWAVLFYGTHTHLPPGVLPGNSDKFIHCAAYAVLAALLLLLRATRGIFPWTSVIGRWIVVAAYGAFDELTQMFVNRTTDLYDWYADVIGAAIGLGVVTWSIWYFHSPKKTDAV